jgi:chromatin remodeling complex protein RSC6
MTPHRERGRMSFYGGEMAKKSAKRAGAGRAPSAKKTAKKSAKKTARKTAKKSTKRAGGGRGRANAAFMAPVNPDAALGAVVGDKPMPRTEITKKLWAYIKKNGLQDAKNRRNINADAKLKPVFNGKSTVSMFEMTKLVNKHVR